MQQLSRTRKLTLSAMVAALCVALMYLSVLVPRVSLAITALAGIFPAAVVIVCGSGWAAGTFVTAAALGLLLLPEKTAPLWFAFFFGHYPIWKALIERLQTRLGKVWIGWILKLLGACLCVGLLYFLFRGSFLAGIPAAVRSTAGPIVVGLILAAAFVAYDIAFSILIGYFRARILPRIR
jgi:hypothetical protein